MMLDKRDLLTIAVLSIVFLSVATWNLGMTQTPVSTTRFSVEQSFQIDLGTATDVKTVMFLLKDGNMTLTVSVGSPDNWQVLTYTSFADYYKWYEIGVRQNTQYLKFNFNQSSSDPIIAEVAAIDEANQTVPITSVRSLNPENRDLSALVDEQDRIQYPPTYMSQTYFDEIYFTRTAEQYLRLEWPYEWTHPPLGKLIQAAGMVIFGYSPFGWRITGVIFATLMIPVMYLLGKKLFGTWIGAFASAFLLTFDFMHFTMGRMGTADTYVVFFSLLSQLFFLTYFLDVVKKGWKTSVLPLFLAVVFFALGFSTKWLVLYGAVGMLALLAVLRLRDVAKLKEGLAAKYAAFFDHPFLLLLGFVGVAVAIYFATYIPDMIIGRPFYGTYGGVLQLQFDMYGYHSTLVATHAFASPWWSWPFLVSPSGYVPLWLSVSTLPNGLRSTIAVLGNPAVWWVGFASIILVTERAVRGKELVGRLCRKLTKKLRAWVWRLRKRLTRKSQVSESEMPISSSESDPATAEPVTASPSGRRRDVAAIFIAVMFFFSWVPYIFISRVTFIYHFYVAMPYLCFASAYLINKYWKKRLGKLIALILFGIVVALFVLFYNVTSGVPATSSWIDSLKWFPSWYF